MGRRQIRITWRLDGSSHSFRRTVQHGHVSSYPTWTDEALNIVLRRVAQASHASTFDKRVFNAFHLIGTLKLDPRIYG